MTDVCALCSGNAVLGDNVYIVATAQLDNDTWALLTQRCAHFPLFCF